MRDDEDADATAPGSSAAALAHDSWLLLPWRRPAPEAAEGRSRRRADGGDDDGDDSDDHSGNNVDGGPTGPSAASSRSSRGTRLTQFPPYGSRPAPASAAELPQDFWMHHLSALSALATVSEQQAQTSPVSSPAPTPPQLPNEPTTAAPPPLLAPSPAGGAPTAAPATAVADLVVPLDFDWDAPERELWTAPGDHRTGRGNNSRRRPPPPQESPLSPRNEDGGADGDPDATAAPRMMAWDADERHDDLLRRSLAAPAPPPQPPPPSSTTTAWRDRMRQRRDQEREREQRLRPATSAGHGAAVCADCHRAPAAGTMTGTTAPPDAPPHDHTDGPPPPLCLGCRWRRRLRPVAPPGGAVPGASDDEGGNKNVPPNPTESSPPVTGDAAQTSTDGSAEGGRKEAASGQGDTSPGENADALPGTPPAMDLDPAVAAPPVSEPLSRRAGYVHLGTTAADHLERVARHLLPLHAPLLWNRCREVVPGGKPAKVLSSKERLERHQTVWINTLLSLATKTVACVEPNVRDDGDLLDILPHVKVKTIAGGAPTDCTYWSGVMFRRTVAHKTMATTRAPIYNPRILLLQGGIEFVAGAASATMGGSGGGRHTGIGAGRHRPGSAASSAAARHAAPSPSAASARQSGSSMASAAVGSGLLAGAPKDAYLPPHVTLSSLDTLREHEDTYLERLVRNMLQICRPDVVLAGGSVCRQVQERLAQAQVAVVSHVKPGLLQRIARQTRAKILSPEGLQSLAMMNPLEQAGASDAIAEAALQDVIGECYRFRLVTFRDNDLWIDTDLELKERDRNMSEIPLVTKAGLRSIEALLADQNTSHQDRQAALVAKQLGQGVLDGSEAIKAGIARRGVAQTFVMLEGCPKRLGCTVVLRGADKTALKQAKTVFRFLVKVAYNLRLETRYLRERGARIRPNFLSSERNAMSSSLCVDFGEPPQGMRARPWNGSNADRIPRLQTGEITAFDHQSILITSVWMTQQSQCCPAEVKGICYYSMQDVALGQFLRDSCFNLSLKCQNPNCKKSVLDHSLSFVHHDGLVNITVEEMDDELPPAPKEQNSNRFTTSASLAMDGDRPICTWSYCKNCKKVISPLQYISDDTWKFSFGKFLETFFYNRDAIFNAPDLNCTCCLQSAARLYFGSGKLAAQFAYEDVRPLGVFVRRTLPMEAKFQREEGLRRLDIISSTSSKLFVKFDKQIEKISRETRTLFNSPTVRPEHLQTVLSELNKMSSYVDDASKTLQDKIASVSDNLRRHGSGEHVNTSLFRFPWFVRRYLFLLTSAWNEKLSAAGQAISTMKKLAASSSSRDGGPSVNIGDPLNEELMESMKQLRKLNEHYTRFNMTDITQVLPSHPDHQLQQDGDYEDDFDKDELSTMEFADGLDADVIASRRRLQTKGASVSDRSSSRTRPTKSLGTKRGDSAQALTEDASAVAKPTAGGAVKSALTRFFNRGGRDQDSFTVDLALLAEGRPRLAPGLNGVVVPVSEDQLSTIIAYSLASTEYAKQFKYFSRQESSVESESPQDAAQGNTSTETSRKTPKGVAAGSLQAPESVSSQRSGSSASNPSPQQSSQNDIKSVEHRMLIRAKSHVKHTFRDFDEKGQATCKFVCTTYWATQFHAVRQVFLSHTQAGTTTESGDHDAEEFEQSYVESLSSAYAWAASGGKSGASFHRTSDDRFVIKFISRTELQMFLDCAPAYFEYLSKAFFHGLPTVLCKIVGVYQIGVHNRITGKRTMEQVAVMQNIFYNRKISRVFDLKGSLRGRFTSQVQGNKDDGQVDMPPNEAHGGRSRNSAATEEPATNGADDVKEASGVDETDKEEKGLPTLLDGDFLEFTKGRPMPLTDRAKAMFQMSILNDTLFLSIINVLDYSILIGVDEENMELVVGIIDFMRQYDIMKQMERVGKSLPMVVGSEAPTIIQPPLYKARFSSAMERYFMGVPNKWTTI